MLSAMKDPQPAHTCAPTPAVDKQTTRCAVPRVQRRCVCPLAAAICAMYIVFSALAIPQALSEPIPSFGHDRVSRFTIRSEKPPEHARRLRRRAEPVAVAKQHMADQFKLNPETDLALQGVYRDAHNGVAHVHFIQTVNGTDVMNAVTGVALDRDNNVISVHEMLASKEAIASLKAKKEEMDPRKAVQVVQSYLTSNLNWKIAKTASLNDMNVSVDGEDGKVSWVKGAAFTDDPIWTKPRLFMVESQNGKGSLNWVVDVRAKTLDNWIDVQVKSDGSVVGLNDWTTDAVYRAFPAVGFANDPGDGQRQVVQDPEDKLASPKGWAAPNGTTVGNNVKVQESKNGRTRRVPTAEGTQNNQIQRLSFDFQADLTPGTDPKEYLDASLTNAFYVINLVHDICYRYGFNEESGNFQFDNFGKGGKGNDAVVVNIQDNSALNNANFRTPPDGQAPVLTAFLFNSSGAITDGAMDDSILIHESQHGVSGRLTGGSKNPNCLTSSEAGGMNEGWSDALAVYLKMREGDTRSKDSAVAAFMTGKKQGIRRFPYSTNIQTNPLTYADVPKQKGVHQTGEIWAAMLYETYWNLVDKHSFQANWRRTKQFNEGNTPLGGNIQMLQNMFDGLKLQPCNPTFIQARDAILLADRQNFSGDNQCELWSGFAKRGLGVNAGANGKADFSLPSQCNQGRRRVKF